MKKRTFNPLLGRFSVWDVLIYSIIAVLIFITLYPLWYTLVVSFSTETGYYGDPFHIIPRSFTLSTYEYIFRDNRIVNSFFVTVIVTVYGVVLSIILSCIAAYVLSRKALPGKKFMFMFLIITMYLSGGTTPWYIIIKSMGLSNSLSVMVLPLAINTFNVILLKNYFESLPESITESAEIDGANDFIILWRIMVPVSIPIVATVILFYAVAFWNDWFAAYMFNSSSPELTPMALVLKNMISNNTVTQSLGYQRTIPNMIKSAVIVVNILPIMCIYPFIQKYFVRGIMLGSVKE